MSRIFELCNKIGRKWRREVDNLELAQDYFNVLLEYRSEDKEDAQDALLDFCHDLDNNMPFIIHSIEIEDANDFVNLHRDVMNVVAPFDFDTYCRFIEWNRPPEQQFYMPRRKQLLPAVLALQQLADGKLDLLTLSFPPGVGKTTLALFFLSWIGGREPNKPILSCSHSGSFLQGIYKELLRILDADGEYLFNSVFPQSPVTGTDAQNLRIDLDKRQRFETFQFTSVGAGNAGKCRCESLLYCDDLVEGLEQALSRDRMEKLWQTYITDLRQRKKGRCPELHIATRWSVHDVIGKLEAQYHSNPRAKFMKIPALNADDESNFDYKFGVGFSTAFYKEQREVMCNGGDEASWRALYMNEPFERDGQLYSMDELRRFFELPKDDNGEVLQPDMIISACDTKNKGADYCVMPVGYVYGEDIYIAYAICDNGKLEAVEERLAQTLVGSRCQLSCFESNTAGYKIAEGVQKRVNELGGKCSITTKYTTQNKDTKIVAESPFIKQHFLFYDDSCIPNKDYRMMLNMLTTYTTAGKNSHDDVPDAMAQLSIYFQSMFVSKITLFKRPF